MKKFSPLIVFYFILTIGVSQSIFWPCESNDTCTVDNSKCSTITNNCECNEFDWVFSSDYTKCLKASSYGETCEDSVQCNLMPSGANCKSGVCECNERHTYVRGRCRPLNGLGENCKTELDCYFGYDRQSVTCRNKICECASGYYQRYGNICRHKSKAIGDACVVHTDCETIGNNVKCVALQCQSTAVTTPSAAPAPAVDIDLKLSANHTTATNDIVNGIADGDPLEGEAEESHKSETTTKSREIAVQTSLDLFELKPLRNQGNYRNFTNQHQSTVITKREDDDKTFSTLSNTEDDGEDKKYGSACSNNGKSCKGLPHSICAANVCICREGYYNKLEKCFAELGEIAESQNECDFLFDELSNQCICQKNYFYDRNLRACKKPIHYNLSCTSHSQCSPFGAAMCHKDVPKRCTCMEYAEFDVAQQLCAYKKGLGSQCDKNDTCSNIVNHSFCLNQHCVCNEHYFQKNESCLPGVGVDCKTDSDCSAPATICEITDPDTDKTCQCRKGFVHFKDECLKEAEDIGDDCIDIEQCKPLLGICNENKCLCKTNQHVVNGRCVDQKGLGEPCKKAGECFLEKPSDKVECRNSICQCKFGYQADVQQKACIRIVPKKNSSGRPSALKIITFLLIGSACIITGAALKQAYY